MSQLRFTTLVDAPLTVTHDVARGLGRPWPWPLREVSSRRPDVDVFTGGGGLIGTVTHTRRFHPTGAGTLVEEQVDWTSRVPGVLGRLLDQTVVRGRLLRAMQAHLDLVAAAAQRRAEDVVQVVGAALVGATVVGAALEADVTGSASLSSSLPQAASSATAAGAVRPSSSSRRTASRRLSRPSAQSSATSSARYPLSAIHAS